MVSPLGDGRFAIDGRGEWLLARDGDVTWIGHGGSAWAVRPAASAELGDAAADGDVRAPMPGQVLLVHAATGDTVAAGDPLVVLESMKMELVLTAPVDGEVAELTVAVGDKVAVDQSLARVEATPMNVLRSHANPGSEEFRANRDGQRGAHRRPQRPAGARAPGRRRARPRAPRRPRQAAAPRARRPPARSRGAVPGVLGAGRPRAL